MVATITCLDRSFNVAQHHAASRTARGLTATLTTGKVHCIQADFADSSLGLTSQVYGDLAASADIVIHNAWPVSFNLVFSSYEPHIRGVRNLLKFVAKCEHKASFWFMSSVSVAGQWGTLPGALELVPEVMLQDWRVAKMGYGQSKLVAERLSAEASRTTGVDVVVCRLGQLAGPVQSGETGVWNRNEWFPSMILSSLSMGVVPSDLGPLEEVDWVPIDTCADIVVDLLLANLQSGKSGTGASRKEKSPTIYHVVNPKSVPYSYMVKVITGYFSKVALLTPVPFVAWVESLEKVCSEFDMRSTQETDNALDAHKVHPAARLMVFFDDLRDKARRSPNARAAKFDTKMTQGRSSRLANLSAVNEEQMVLWLKQWNFDNRSN